MIKTHIQPSDTVVLKHKNYNNQDVLETFSARNHRKAQLLKAAMLEHQSDGVIHLIVESSVMCSKVITQVSGISDEHVVLTCGNSIPIASIRQVEFEAGRMS